MITDIKLIETNLDRLTFYFNSDSTSPTFYIYFNGIFKGTQTDNIWTISNIKENEIFRFEVFDEEPENVDKFFASNFQFNFYNKNTNIISFLVEEKINDGSFTNVGVLYTQPSKYFYSFSTKNYNDTDEITIKITPKYLNGLDGDPYISTKIIKTYPDQIISEVTDSSGQLFIDISQNLSDSVTITIPNLFE